MTTLLYQVSLAAESGIPADLAINTWHTDSNSVDPADDAEGFSDLLFSFYANLDEFMSPCLSGLMTVKVYDLLDPQPRAPIYEDTQSPFTPTGTPLPSEVAIAMSYHGIVTSGAVPARRRGRIFLGPFNTTVMGTPENGQAVVVADFRTSVAGLAESLQGSGSSITWGWSVFSPTSAGAQPWDAGDLNVGTLPVIGGHIDNAFDTIRSRGPDATARTLWPVT